MISGEYCDVCSNQASTQDYQVETTAILTTIQEIPKRGEKCTFVSLRYMICNTLECHQDDTLCFFLLGSRVHKKITDPISQAAL